MALKTSVKTLGGFRIFCTRLLWRLETAYQTWGAKYLSEDNLLYAISTSFFS